MAQPTMKGKISLQEQQTAMENIVYWFDSMLRDSKHDGTLQKRSSTTGITAHFHFANANGNVKI